MAKRNQTAPEPKPPAPTVEDLEVKLAEVAAKRMVVEAEHKEVYKQQSALEKTLSEIDAEANRIRVELRAATTTKIIETFGESLLLLTPKHTFTNCSDKVDVWSNRRDQCSRCAVLFLLHEPWAAAEFEFEVKVKHDD